MDAWSLVEQIAKDWKLLSQALLSVSALILISFWAGWFLRGVKDHHDNAAARSTLFDPRKYRNRTRFSVKEAAFLWTDRAPGGDIYEIAGVGAAFQEIDAACKAGTMTGVTKVRDGFVISRAGLKAFARSQGEKPAFLLRHKPFWAFWRD